MKKFRIKTPFNYMEFEQDHEVNNEPSLTIPDQTMTIPEILERYARGLPIGGSNENEYYDEDDTLPDPRTLDLEERFQLADKIRQELSEFGKSQVSTNVDNSVDKTETVETVEVIDDKS